MSETSHTQLSRLSVCLLVLSVWLFLFDSAFAVAKPPKDPPTFLKLAEPSRYRKYSRGETIEVKWESNNISRLNIYTFSNGYKELVARNLEPPPDNTYSLELKYSKYRLYRNFRIFVEGFTPAGEILRSKLSAPIALKNNPPAGMNDDFSKIFDITDVAFDNVYNKPGGLKDCGTHTYQMEILADKYGYKHRRVNIYIGPYGNSHVFPEIYVPSMKQWIAFDPTFDLYYTVDGIPASAYDMHEALVSGRLESMGIVKHNDAITRYEDYYLNGFTLFKNFQIQIENRFFACFQDKYSIQWDRCRIAVPDKELLYLPPGSIHLKNDKIIFDTKDQPLSFSIKELQPSRAIDVEKFINSPAYILNDYFKPILYGDKQYIPQGDFETDRDGDGMADGWTGTGIVSARLSDEEAISGKYSQYVEFGPDGGSISYELKDKESENFRLHGFYKITRGNAGTKILPDPSSCCCNESLEKHTIGHNNGHWNFFVGSTFRIYENNDNIISFEAASGTVMLLDDIQLLKVK